MRKGVGQWLGIGLAALGIALTYPASAADTLTVTGAGATFPYPLYSKWFYEYSNSHPGAKFNYQSIGSGGGVKQITAGTIDFGATDAPMTDDELAKLPGPIFHIPTAIGAVAVVYNLKGIPSGLKVTPDALVDMYYGRITRWNDPRVAAANPGVKLPASDIVVTHRSDGSGTTDIFTNYLSAVSTEWRAKVGRGKSVNWPVGLGGKGNEGVAGVVKQTPGAIGYVELAYAMQNRMAVAALRNREGNFVVPTLASTSAAAAGAAKTMPDDFRLTLVDAPGKDSYGICGLTWLLVYKEQKNEAKGKALVAFLKWAVRDGQKMTTPLLYAPIPTPVAEQVDRAIRQIHHKGKSLY
ncbi:MAG TPA: phosphate ABC transporter substrate-binding protein PstS [Candidatus Limnocylindrales bacterium]|nr:phosphate ABC transporter substrate-binding protein PstS [Candidatus Limnocylindrales bacterium]